MSTQRNPIDELFRENLSGARREPSEGVWKGLESRFFGGMGKMRFIIFLSTALILISSGLAIYFRLANNNGAAYAQARNMDTAVQARTSDLTSGIHLSPPTAINHKEITSLSKADPLSEVPNSTAIQPASSEQEVETSASISSSIYSPSQTMRSYASQGSLAQSNTDLNRQAFSSLELMASLESVGLPVAQTMNAARLENFTLSPLDFRMKDDYAKPANLGFGAHVTPGITYYDPNPDKYFLSADFTVNYNPSRWLVQAGVGVHMMQDVGKYRINYTTYDSIGYYREVTSFEFVKDDPDSLIIHYRMITVHDSIDHISLTERNNRYSYLTLPVHLGYRIWQTDRLGIYLKTGLVFSFLVGKSEPVADVNISDASQVRVEKQVPARVRTNWHYTLGVQFDLRLSDNAVFSLEPYFGQYFTPVYVNDPGWNNKNPYMIGIRSGLNFRLK